MNATIKSGLIYFAIFLASFIGLFLVFSSTPGKKAVNNFFVKTHLSTYQKLLPELRIKFNQKGEGIEDWNTIHFEFGSIKEEKRIIADARKRGLSSVDIPLETAIFHLDVFYIPFWVFLFALFIATPIPIKNKLTGLLWGVVILFVFQFFRMYLKMLHTVDNHKIGAYDYEGFTEKFLFYSANIMQAGFTTMIVVLIWAFLVFNKKNTALVKEKLSIA